MKTINDLLIVPVPIETYLSKIQDVCPKLMIKYKNGGEKLVRLIDLPDGNWQILGEITEDKCTIPEWVLCEAIETLNDNGLFFVNPYGNEPLVDNIRVRVNFRADYLDRHEQWQTAQSNTSPKYLVLRKI